MPWTGGPGAVLGEALALQGGCAAPAIRCVGNPDPELFQQHLDAWKGNGRCWDFWKIPKAWFGDGVRDVQCFTALNKPT